MPALPPVCVGCSLRECSQVAGLGKFLPDPLWSEPKTVFSTVNVPQLAGHLETLASAGEVGEVLSCLHANHQRAPGVPMGWCADAACVVPLDHSAAACALDGVLETLEVRQMA